MLQDNEIVVYWRIPNSSCFEAQQKKCLIVTEGDAKIILKFLNILGQISVEIYR
jgi:hypothetical protein